MTPKFIVDTSALSRAEKPLAASVLPSLFDQGEVATCGMGNLEVLFSSRSYADFRLRQRQLREGVTCLPMHQGHFDRAAQIMYALCETGQHRAASIPDLLLAAVGEECGLTLVHYDESFDRIASITGQSVQWVVPRGST